MRPKTTTAIVGEAVTVRCPYPEQFETKDKFFYKWDGHYFTTVIRTSETQRGRFSISEDRSSAVLSVRIRDVREDDGGVYYCGVWTGGQSVSYFSFYTEIKLDVFDSSVAITVCICVTLLLIGGSALIYYKFKHSSPTIQTETNDTVEILSEAVEVEEKFIRKKNESLQLISIRNVPPTQAALEKYTTANFIPGNKEEPAADLEAETQEKKSVTHSEDEITLRRKKENNQTFNHNRRKLISEAADPPPLHPLPDLSTGLTLENGGLEFI
ncbi:hypothetical protein AOLI_G00233870 [Acnodon oligacanthus]